jgi:hypothetical protein
MNISLWLSVSGMVALISGCAGIVHEGGLKHEDGWRSATVVSVGKGSEYTELLAQPCKAEDGDKVFAKVQYSGPYLRRSAYPIDTVPGLLPGAQVHINLKECRIVPAVVGH